MKYITTILVITFNFTIIFSQGSFQASGDCQRSKNIHCADAQTSYMNKDNVRATFKFNHLESDGKRYNCTGTMINQFYDAGGRLRQYFITADHCFQEYSLDFEFEFFFNYQSPNCDDSSVPANTFIDPISRNVISARVGNRYSFSSRVRRVANNGWVDGALFEILTPIPPHFNVYYAGWDVTINPLVGGLPKYVIHHPRGDIKKSAYTFTSIDILQNAYCHTITVIIDAVLNFFFGWITTFRTETLCTYIENPKVLVPFFTSGVLEHGSSGASLFTTSNRITGMLSGSLSTCDVRGTLGEWFGRLHSFWNASGSLRQALDSRKKTYLENAFGFVTGIDGQQPNCFSGNPLALNGNYFRAQDYQPENKITINASTRAVLATGVGTDHNGGRLRAFAGSDFVINAPDIDIGTGDFDIDPNATFEMNNQACSPANARETGQEDALSNCNLARMEFDPEFQATEVEESVSYAIALSPNPASKEIKLEFNEAENQYIKIEILNSTGTILKNIETQTQQSGLQSILINSSDLLSGTYFCKFTSQSYSQTLKFIILK